MSASNGKLSDALLAAMNEALATMDGAPSLRRVSGRALYETEYPQRQFIVDGLIKRGDLVMLAGRPKSGKSWLMLQLAQAIDTGAQWLGRNVTSGKVLFVALEDGERRIHERLHIRRWNPKQAEFAFGLFPLTGDGLRQLEAVAEEFDALFLDTFRAACGGADENNNAEMGAIAQALADIAHQKQRAIIIAHHTRKGGSDDPFETIRGAGAIRAAYDVGLVLERQGKEREAVLRVESRDIEAEDMTIRFDPAQGWTYEGGPARIEEIRAGRRVVQALRELGDGRTTEEIAKHMGISRQGALKQLRNAEREGVVRRVAAEGQKPGKHKRGDSWHLA